MPLISGGSATHRDSALCCEWNSRSIRDPRFKYGESYTDIEELCDLDPDPHELHNLPGGDLARGAAYLQNPPAGAATEARRICSMLQQRVAQEGWLR